MKVTDIPDYERTLIRNNTIIVGSNKFLGDEKFSGIFILAVGEIKPIFITRPIFETAEEAEEAVKIIVEKLGGKIDESQRVTVPSL